MDFEESFGGFLLGGACKLEKLEMWEFEKLVNFNSETTLVDQNRNQLDTNAPLKTHPFAAQEHHYPDSLSKIMAYLRVGSGFVVFQRLLPVRTHVEYLVEPGDTQYLTNTFVH